MPIAAVPRYLGTDFSDASPGMRFGMYLKLWGVNERTQELLWKTHDIKYVVRGRQRQERAIKDENKNFALEQASKLTDNDKSLMQKLAQKQSDNFDNSIGKSKGYCLYAQSIAPFVTGMGNEHPLENGFAFLNPYGLPYLPGSGVKGVLRQAARELASGEWGNTDGDTEDSTGSNTEGWSKEAIDLLFGKETADGDSETLRGVLSFWDVIPQIAGNELLVEIMTPHQSGYYQNGDTPHDSGQPNPISFLTVPPQSQFAFYVVCDTTRLRTLAANSRNDSLYSAAEAERLLQPIEDNGGDNSTVWKQLLQHAFEHAFQWLGFGAKTSVGYGEMETDHTAMRQREQEAQERAEELAEQQKRDQAEKQRQAELAAMSDDERYIDELLQNRENENWSDMITLYKAVEDKKVEQVFMGEVLKRLKAEMKKAKKWRETNKKKKPEGGKDYQRTLKVMQWLKENP